MKTKLLAAIAFGALCSFLRADPTPGIDIIGVAPAEGQDHLKTVHVRIRIENHYSVPLYYLAAGKNGVVVETETKINGTWKSSVTVITGIGWEEYELKPGATLEATVPVVSPGHVPKGSPPANQCPIRLRFDCSKFKDGGRDVSLYSDQHDPLSANQLPDPTSPSVTPPAGAGGAPSVAADH